MVSTRRGLPGRVEIDATVVVRVAALPVTALAELRCAATWESVQEILSARDRLAAEGRRLAGELEPVIGTTPPGPARAALVATRRALYNTRRPGGHVWPGATDWVADLDRHDALVRRLPGLLEQERRGACEVLRRWAGADAFRYGLLQAGPSMSGALSRWLAAPPGSVPPRRVALRLAKYLARVVAKTSPHATFMTTALGTWSDDGEPICRPGPWAWRSAVEPNVPLLLRLLTDLARDDAGLAALFEVRPNPSLHEDDGRLWWMTGQEDAYSGVAVSEPLRRLLSPPYEDARLVELGLLERRPPVADQDAAHLGTLIDRLGPHRVGKSLAAVQEALDRYPDAADVTEREELRRRVRSAFTELAGGDAGRLPDRNLFHENAVVTTPGPRLSRDAWGPALDDLRTIIAFAAVLDRDGIARRLAADLFAEWFGEGAEAQFGRFHRMLAERTAPGTPAGELHALMFPWEETLLSGAWAEAPAALRGLLPETPDAVRLSGSARPVGSVSCFVQVIGPPDESPVRLVLNGIGPGYGAMRSRVHRLLRVAGVPVGANPQVGRERGLPVEISGLFGSNVNLRSPVAAHEIAYPGVVPGTTAFGLGELTVRHEPGGLALRHAGTRLFPVYTGMVAPMLLPRTARLLLQLFGDLPSPAKDLAEVFAPPPEPVPDGVERTARVSVGRVTVARAAWYVTKGEVPRRGKSSETAYLLALAAWFARHDLPERCFVSSRDPGARARAARLGKPTYLDLADPALVTLFDRGLDTSGPVIVFHELLPGFEAAAGGHVSEYVVEVGHD
ncbi:lantibiotic dehydratase [Herbidospora mongoliensis]|uniref:lantibiotic dehydratase n=1 Tax=Herbidospora mongoliensis TaxID=688067 RepID=UPI000833F9A5|nr:lantibiotic dehydratase [Herbidospora mongoliensis]